MFDVASSGKAARDNKKRISEQFINPSRSYHVRREHFDFEKDVSKEKFKLIFILIHLSEMRRVRRVGQQ